MAPFSRYDLYSFCLNDPSFIAICRKNEDYSVIVEALKINCALLMDVEDECLGQNSDIFSKLNENADKLRKSNQFSNEKNEYLEFLKNCKSSSFNNNELLAKALKEIAKINNKLLNRILKSKNIPAKLAEKPEEWNQVFLSHAFSDKLYAFVLFYKLYREGIYLYVDWMHNGELNPNVIKEALAKALDESEQLLLLRTPNSELSVKGSQMIRGWCSWELGYFYARDDKRSELYYLEQYDLNGKTQISAQLYDMGKFCNTFDEHIDCKKSICAKEDRNVRL